MRILVTGGQGFIGTRLVEKLTENDENIVEILDLKSGRDIRTDPLDGKYDVVYHLAALRSVPKSFDNPRDYFDTNVYGSYRIFEVFNNTRIVNISTSSARNPIAPYGLSKKLAEHITLNYKDNIVSLRLFNPFGEGGLCPDLVIPIFAKAMLNNEPVYIHSDGNQDRDFTYVGDVVDEIIFYASSPHSGIKEVGYGKSVSINEVFKAMAEYYGYKKEPIYTERRIGDQIHTKAADPLHIRPVGFKKGLERTMKWYKDNL